MSNRYKSPTPAPNNLFALGGVRVGSSASLPGTLGTRDSEGLHILRPAIDPTTLVIHECISLSSAMRKAHRNAGGVAAFLGGEFFGDEDEIISNGRASNLATRNPQGDPLTSSFIQLRSILTTTDDIHSLDSLTLLQPFLMVIKAPTTSGHVTQLSLNAVSKFLTFQIISLPSKNLQQALIQVVSALCNCRFEQGDQNLDDAVLLKVLRLLEIILESPLSNLLTNESISEVVQVCWSLAINKKRSEVLRRAAEMAMEAMSFRIFSRLAEIPTSAIDNDLTVHFDPSSLPKDTIGAGANDSVTEESAEAAESKLDEEQETDYTEDKEKKEEDEKENDEQTSPESEQPFGILSINDFLTILVSMIAPSSQYSNMESTRVFALSLINNAIEVAGHDILRHPALLSVVADPVYKHTLQLITTTESTALLRASMQLFTTMSIVMGSELKPQMELATRLIFESIMATAPEPAAPGKPAPKQRVVVRSGVAKEILVESLSLLWTRNPRSFFVGLFTNYDCDFDKSDLALQVVDNLCQLALPESAIVTTDNVPPICLEGLLSLVMAINDHSRSHTKSNFPRHRLLDNRDRKAAFVKCTEAFNKKPKDGIAKLVEHGFISDENNIKALAEFFLSKSGRLNKKVLGEYLAKPTSKALLTEFIGLMDFTDLRVDEAIRILLKTFRLPGESQQIERIVELFAERYIECYENSTPEVVEGREPVRPDRDSVFVLSYSIIMLNTDLHNPQVKKQMLLTDYQRNLKGQYNRQDYPEWYLSKIYSSIKDREIIMPEEHHGTDKWFDDVWNNVVQSESSEHREAPIDIDSDNQFDKALFDTVANMVFSTLFAVFNEASDDHVITRIMSAVDKCSNICLQYELPSQFETLVGALCQCTRLVDTNGWGPSEPVDDDLRESIPLTQITVEEGERSRTITVGTLAVWFGRDFKAQISTVVLFRLLKKVSYGISNDESGKSVMKVILTLFENCLVDAQELLPGIHHPAVKPKYIINKVKGATSNSGLLSTFSSFLKGYGSDAQPEPSAAEIEATMSTLDCVSSLQLASVFVKTDSVNVSVVDLFLGLLPEHDDSTKRFYEAESLLLLQLAVTAAHNEMDQVKVLGATNHLKGLSKSGALTLLAIKMSLLANIGDEVEQNNALDATFTDILGMDKEFFAKNGKLVLQQLLHSLPERVPRVLHREDYWKVLRMLGSLQQLSPAILDFLESIHNSPDQVSSKNFMFILGLLDEISSMGALGAANEQRGEERQQSDQSSVITNAKRSICLTAEMTPITRRDSFHELRYSHLQALAHQCFNPCREVRGFSLGLLRSTILATELEEGADEDNAAFLTAFGLFEYGLFPLLAELTKPEVLETDARGFVATQVEALSLVSKVFLQYSTSFSKEKIEQVWLYILESFVAIRKLAHEDDVKEYDEAAPEMIKNMIMVLQNTESFANNVKLNESTWEKIDQIYPRMKKELGVQDQEPARESVPEQPVFEQPASEEPSPAKPVSEQPVPDQPVPEQLIPPSVSQPISEAIETLSDVENHEIFNSKLEEKLDQILEQEAFESS